MGQQFSKPMYHQMEEPTAPKTPAQPVEGRKVLPTGVAMPMLSPTPSAPQMARTM